MQILGSQEAADYRAISGAMSTLHGSEALMIENICDQTRARVKCC